MPAKVSDGHIIESQDPAGWYNFCTKCGRWKWIAWLPSSRETRSFEPDKETKHECRKLGL